MMEEKLAYIIIPEKVANTRKQKLYISHSGTSDAHLAHAYTFAYAVTLICKHLQDKTCWKIKQASLFVLCSNSVSGPRYDFAEPQIFKILLRFHRDRRHTSNAPNYWFVINVTWMSLIMIDLQRGDIHHESKYKTNLKGRLNCYWVHVIVSFH